MRKQTLGKRIQAFALAVVMVATTFFAYAPEVEAVKGDKKDVGTGLEEGTNIDTSDTISLPIEIYDYDNDGMLFEYSMGVENPAKYVEDYSRTDDITDEEIYWYPSTGYETSDDFWVAVQNSGKTNQYIELMWARNGSQPSGIINRAEDIIKRFTPSVKASDIRYVVLVYRMPCASYYDQNNAAGNDDDRAGLIGFSTTETESSGFSGWTKIPKSTVGSSNWNYMICDLLQSSSMLTGATSVTNLYMHSPLRKLGEYMDLASIAFFPTLAEAEKYGEYGLSLVSDNGSNMSYSLLYGNRNESNTTVYEAIDDVSTTDDIIQINTYTTKVDTELEDYDFGYKLYGTFLGTDADDRGVATLGLLESGLVDGKPRYREETVKYIAELMKNTLTIEETGANNVRNYKFVKGAPSTRFGTDSNGNPIDLATALRMRITDGLGTYDATLQKIASGKKLIGTWEECGENISTYYDAAYFLLNSIYTANSYNEPQDDYDYLILSKGTMEDGKEAYIFDAGFTDSAIASSAKSATAYDEAKNTISNSSALGKSYVQYGDKDVEWTTTYPFLPITNKNNTEGQTNSPNYQDAGVASATTDGEHYIERNYNYVIASEGQFVYYADDELFFDFEGDDDVYLFVNGELVLDIGGAHGITKEKINLNEYVEAAKAGTLGSEARNAALNLNDGDVCDFNFYYMERHGTGANMRIATNIRVTDPEMETQKKAYQEGNSLSYGDSIDKDKVVEYGFEINNVGQNTLYNLSFRDDDIGVTIDYENGLTIKDGYNGERVFDAGGGDLEVSDLYAIVKGLDKNGNDVEKEVRFTDNNELKEFLVNLTSDDVIESGTGLWEGSSVEIRGFAYKLTADECEQGVFDNIVHSSAWDTEMVGVGQYLIGQATMRVFILAEPMYYQWANHEIAISKVDFISDILEASETENNILAGKVNNLKTTNINKIEECTQKGLATNYSQVTIDGNNNLSVNYTSTGSRVFYVKITYNNSSASVIVPVLINVTDVQDSVYVLDYGLGVDLTEGEEFFRNDTVTVPARGTNATLMTIGNTTPSYGSNKINFTSNTGTEQNPLGEYGDYRFEVIDKHLEQVTELEPNTPYAVICYNLNMALTHSEGSVNGLTGINLVADQDIEDMEPWYYKEPYLIAGSPDNSNGYLNLTSKGASIGTLSESDTANDIYLNKTYRLGAFTIHNSNPSYNSGKTYLNQYGGQITDTVAAVYSASGDGGGGASSSWYFKEIVPASVKLTYTPGGTTGKFMEGFDTIWAAVSVQDAEYSEDPVLGTVDINNEVQMYKKVTTLPANVVYYEDDFPAIKYYEADGETVTNAFTTGSSSDKKQSADQKQEYGQDEIYQTGNTAESGGSLTKIPITKTGNIAYFEFVGTGFEIIGRTNAKDSGTIGVIVTNSEGEKVFSYPVVTEFDNGGDGGDEEIYQVPIIRADNLPKDTYKVTIKGLKSPSNKNSTYLYVDGIRIFQPLGATNENYNANEDGASFTEIRDLILNGNVAVASYDGSTMKVSTGTTTWTENRNDEFEGNVVDSANEYLIYGPNNEVYMQGTHTTSALVFYVKETTDTATHNLQLAVRGVDEGLFVGSNSTGVKAETQFGYKEENGLAWYPLVTNTSSTEQYYTIDYRKCPYDESKQAYQVVVQVADGMASYSSLKMNGLELVSINGEAATLCYVNGVLTEKGNGVAVASEEYPSFDSIQIQMKATKVYAGKLPADTSGNESEDSGNTGDTDNTGDSGNTGDAGNAGDSGSAGNAGNTGDVDDTDNAGDSDNTVDTDNTENSDDADNADDSDKVVKDDTKADDDKETTKAEEGIKTGDQSNILMPVIVMITALGVIAVVIARRKMNR